MAVDVVAYSRAIEIDEEGTLRRLARLRSIVIDPAIAEHSGRVFKTTGDGFLAEFSSSLDALRCAIAVQRAMASTNSDLAEDERMLLRIGVNIGDLIAEGDDV